MALTTQQETQLATAIKASTDPQVIAALSIRDDVTLASWCNAASTFVVWRTTTPVSDIADSIIWANFTPVDTPDGTALWTNRSLACQGKQFNVQTMLVGRDSVPSNKSNFRAGLQDALTNVPSGASGALLSGGWPNVRLAMQRFATNAEKVWTTGTGTQATPGSLGSLDGTLSINDVSLALNRNP